MKERKLIRMLFGMMAFAMVATIPMVGNQTKVQAATEGYHKSYSNHTSHTSTKKSNYKASKYYSKKLTKKSTKISENTTKKHYGSKDVKTVKKTTVVTTRVYYKKTVNKSVKTTVDTKTYTTSYVRPGTPNIYTLRGIIPDKMIQKVVENNIKVSLNPSLSNGAEGVYSSRNHSIQLKQNIDYVFLHEIGHFVSEKTENAAGSTEFRKIYLSEREKYTSFFSDYDSGSYGRSSQTEYFAEAFKDYYFSAKSRSGLKRNCPNTYRYIEKTVKCL